MYELVSAIAKPLNGNGQWKSVEIGNVALNTLYSTYTRIIATLTNPFVPDLVALDLNDIVLAASGQNDTFNQFLATNGNNTLPTSTTLPVLDAKYAKYADAFHAGYKVEPLHPSASPGSEYPPSEKTWLYLTRPDTDYELFGKSCLVNVNGFFHIIDAGPEGVYVKDGNKSAMLSRQNQIGIVSFLGLGELTYVPIATEMVYKQTEDQLFKNRCYIDLGQDVSDKSVMLVLGGYLHLLEPGAFYRTGASTFAIDFDNLPLVDRFYESKDYIDLSSMSLSKTARNPNQVAVSELYSDAALRAYVTLSQSFFVIVNNSDLSVDREQVRKTKMPDMFVSHKRPDWPLVVGAGKVGNYWYSYEDQQYALNCRDSLWNHRLYHTVNVKELVNASPSRKPEHPVSQSNAFFLKIGSQLGTTTMTRAQWLASQA